MKIFAIISNCVEYRVFSTNCGDVLHVYATDSKGRETIVADAERDTAVEQVFVTYYRDDEEISVDVPSELYWKNDPEVLARWIVEGLTN